MGSCTLPSTGRTGKLPSASVMLITMYLLCVIYSGVLLTKRAISESTEKDETHGSCSHYFEVAMSHCYDGKNLVTAKKCSDILSDIISNHVRK